MNPNLDLALHGPLGGAGIAASTTLTMTFFCTVAVQVPRRRGSLGLAAVRRQAQISLLSSGVIVGLGIATLRVLLAGHSRFELFLAVVALLVIGAIIHESCPAIPRKKRPALVDAQAVSAR